MIFGIVHRTKRNITRKQALWAIRALPVDFRSYDGDDGRMAAFFSRKALNRSFETMNRGRLPVMQRDSFLFALEKAGAKTYTTHDAHVDETWVVIPRLRSYTGLKKFIGALFEK